MFRTASLARKSLHVQTGIRAGVAGGGGAGGIGRDNPGATGAGGDADLFTPEQNEYLKKTIGTSVSGALTRFKGEIKTEIGTLFTEGLKSLGPELEKIVDGKIQTLKPAGGDGSGATGASGAAPVKVTETPEYKGLQKQLEQLNTKVTESEKREQAAKESARNVRMRQLATEALVKKGVDPARVRLAVGQLFDVDKRVRGEGDGDEMQLVMKDGGDDVDFETGADAWLRTDEAKIYLPPRGAAGSGDRGGGRRAGATQGKQAKNEASLEDLGNYAAAVAGGLLVGGGSTR